MRDLDNYSSTSTKSQRRRILDYLRSSPLTTIAARVQELKAQGHEVYTHWETVDSGQGKHRVASYVLFTGGNHD